jgi:hypothetical protein
MYEKVSAVGQGRPGQGRNQTTDTEMQAQTSAGITFSLMITQCAQNLPLLALRAEM